MIHSLFHETHTNLETNQKGQRSCAISMSQLCTNGGTFVTPAWHKGFIVLCHKLSYQTYASNSLRPAIKNHIHYQASPYLLFEIKHSIILKKRKLKGINQTCLKTKYFDYICIFIVQKK